MDPQIQIPSEQDLSFERHIVGFKHDSKAASLGLSPIFNYDDSAGPSIVRLQSMSPVRSLTIWFQKKDGEVQQIQFFDIKGDELLSAGFSLARKQTDKCSVQLEENERLLGMKYNLLQNPLDLFEQQNQVGPRIKDV